MRTKRRTNKRIIHHATPLSLCLLHYYYKPQNLHFARFLNHSTSRKSTISKTVIRSDNDELYWSAHAVIE